MTSVVLPIPAIWTGLETIWERCTSFRSRTLASDRPLEDTRGRREFIQDMMNRNPDAFASEQDVHCMMQMFPDKF